MTPAPALAAALETALNLYLGQDPEALRSCASMQDKVIAVSISGLGLSLYLLPDADGIQVLSHYEGQVDTHLRGSPLGLARMSLGSRDDTLFEGTVEIRGDTEAGQQLQDILARANWDWEEQLSRLTGDILAHQIGSVARRTRQLLDGSRTTLERNVSEYLQEESLLLPCRSEVSRFSDEVDHLRSDVDRLSARVERLLHITAAKP